MRMDVVMCTWNSNKPFFRAVLKSIKREIPVHCFILIDRFSKDTTQDVVRSFFPEAKIFVTDKSLAKSRLLGIENVDTKYLIFVDDDIVLPKGWFKKLQNSLDVKTGAIQAHAVPGIKLSYVEKWSKWQEKWAKNKLRIRGLNKKALNEEAKIIEVTEENKNKFLGYTHNTIIKLDLCKDWNPPKDLPVFEDQVLLWHIVKKGYKWKIDREITVQHYSYRNLSEHLRKVKWRFAGQRIIGLSDLSLTQLLFSIFTKRLILSCKACVDLRDPMVIMYVIRLHFAFLDGYLGWEKNMHLIR